MQYCTIADILELCRSFSWDIDNQVISDDRINSIIDEATEITRQLLFPKYNIAQIESNIPHVVKRYCIAKASALLYKRYPNGSSDANKQALEYLKGSCKYYKSVISKGLMLVKNGDTWEEITASYAPSQQVQIPRTMEAMYENGSRSL